MIDGLSPWVLAREDFDTVTLRIPLDVSGAFSGTVRFESNDARSLAFTLLVTGTVTGSAISTSYTGSSATGTGTIVAGFTGGGEACGFSGAQFIAAPPGSAPVPSTLPTPGVAFPHGLFAFVASGCTPGTTLTFTLTYPQALPPGTVYWKHGPTPDDAVPHWYQLPATIAGRVVTFNITDGGLGDDDLDGSNGIIVDQGGPGVIADGDAASIPTLGESARTVLLLVVALTGFRSPQAQTGSGMRDGTSRSAVDGSAAERSVGSGAAARGTDLSPRSPSFLRNGGRMRRNPSFPVSFVRLLLPLLAALAGLRAAARRPPWPARRSSRS